jgi:hypothetical protein
MTAIEFLDRYPENLARIAAYLRDLVRSTFPDAIEKVYTGWKLIGYRLPYRAKGIYFCCIVPQKKENDVLLGFQYGIVMRDPRKLLEGKGTQVRFVRIRQKDMHREEDLIWLIEEGARVALELQTRGMSNENCSMEAETVEES